MALQVWLPLNGNLNNQGLESVSITSSGATADTSGKIGSCMKLISYTELKVYDNINTKSISFGGWFKFNQAEIASVVQTYTYSSSNPFPTGNLLGNDSYGGIGLIWNGNDMRDSQTLTTLYISACLRTPTVNVGTDRIIIPFDTWIHYFLIYDRETGKLSFYTNGQLSASLTPGNSFTDAQTARKLALDFNGTYGGNGPAFQIPFRCNDIRIYDHALSEKEVREISKGLVLHYKLDDPYVEPTINLVGHLSNFGTQWTAGKQPSTATNSPIKLSNGNYLLKGNGNSSSSQCYIYFNSNYWTIINPNTTYTLSVAARIGVGGRFIMYFYEKDSLNGAVKVNTKVFTSTDNQFQVYSMTVTTQANTAKMYVELNNNTGAQDSELELQIYSLQLEQKDHATPYTHASRGVYPQYDKTVYTEPDGSKWFRIVHHNAPATNGRFSQTDDWPSGVYLDSNRWFDVYGLVKMLDSYSYEFMVKQKGTSSSSEVKYRWIQYTSPLTAVWADVQPGKVANNNSSGYTASTMGGLFILNSNSHMVIANATSSNWFGALGCWGTYDGGIPGYPNSTVTTGYIDLYIRADSYDFYPVKDSSGHGYNGTITGTLTTSSDTPRYDLSTIFDGNSYSTTNGFSQQCLVDSFTISAWFYSDSSTNYRGIGALHAGSYLGICFGQWSSNKFGSSIGTGSAWVGSLALTPSLNTWHHYAITYTKNGALIQYLDGVAVDTTVVTALSPVTTDAFRIGRAYDQTTRNWLGKIADVRCYATALSASDIKELYETGQSIDNKGNIYAYEFKEE